MNSTELNDENFPPGSAELIPALPAPPTSSPDSKTVAFTEQDYKTAVRLLVGALLEGTDELRYRAKTWLTNVQKVEQEIDALTSPKKQAAALWSMPSSGSCSNHRDIWSGSPTPPATPPHTRPSIVSRFTRPITAAGCGVRCGGDIPPLNCVANPVNSLEKTGRSEASPSRLLIREQVKRKPSKTSWFIWWKSRK